MKYAPIIYAIVLALVFRVFFLSVYKATSQSMAPQILAGDYILASQISFGFKFAVNQKVYFKNSPQKGELVVLQLNGKSVIKRVLAVPGEEVEFSQNKILINKEPCQQEVIEKIQSDQLQIAMETCLKLKHKIMSLTDKTTVEPLSESIQLSDTEYLVASDNRSPEVAQKTIEIAKYDQIVGKPLLIWMSYASTQDFISSSLGVRWNRILTILE